MTELVRIPGQSPILPGAVRAGELIITSGVVDPALFTDAPTPSLRDQAQAALEQVLRFVEEAGGSAETVMKIEAYIAQPEHVAVWNEVYTAVWPTPGPARTTIVAAFGMPGIEIEIQATAVRA
jgi:2-iminobutanoate/2-iminopropanoate deaminase